MCVCLWVYVCIRERGQPIKSSFIFSLIHLNTTLSPCNAIILREVTVKAANSFNTHLVEKYLEMYVTGMML